MCVHVTKCPDAAQGCAGALFCPNVADLEYSYVGQRYNEHYETGEQRYGYSGSDSWGERQR